MFILIRYYWDNTDVYGVFSSFEKVEQFMKDNCYKGHKYGTRVPETFSKLHFSSERKTWSGTNGAYVVKEVELDVPLEED